MTHIHGPKWLRRAWLAAMLLMLIGAYLSVWVEGGNTELYQLILIGGSNVLTFPAGLIVSLGDAYAAMHIVHWIGPERVENLPGAVAIPMSIFSTAIWEVAMLAAGYFQWFWLVPKVYSRVRDSLREGFRWR